MGREKKKASKKRSRKTSYVGKSGRKKKVQVVPGYTRTQGAYGRSLPCGPEKKFIDRFLGTITPVTGLLVPVQLLGTFTGTGTQAIGTPALLTNGFLDVAAGTTDNTRIGNLICVKNFNFKGHIEYNWGAVLGDAARARVVFFWDLQANGAVAQWGNIFKDPANGGATLGTMGRMGVNAFRNLDEVARFKIIKDKTFYYNPKGVMQTGFPLDAAFPVKVSWKGDMPVHYSGITGGISEMRSENLSVIAWGDTADSAFQFYGCGRTKFTDL